MSIENQQERREGYAEVSQEFITKINAHVDQENGFIRAAKMFSLVISLFIAVLAWVLLEKNSDLRDMQKTIYVHSMQMERTLVVVETIANDNKRQQGHLDRITEVLQGMKR